MQIAQGGGTGLLKITVKQARENWTQIYYIGGRVRNLVLGNAGKKYKHTAFCFDVSVNAD